MLGQHHAVGGLDVERRSLQVGRKLHAASVEVPEPVERAVVVDPARHVRRLPLGARAEEQHVLLRDPQRQQLAEQRRQPAPARPHHMVGLEHLVAGDHPRAIGPRSGAHDACAGCDRLDRQRPGRVARAEDPGLGLVQRECEVVGADRREQRRRIHPLARDAELAQRHLRRRLPPVLAPREPRHAGFDDERRVDRAPELQSAPRRARVPAVGAVRAADQPRLAARAGTHVARRDGLDERDVPTVDRKLACGCGAEDPGAADDYRGHAPDATPPGDPPRAATSAALGTPSAPRTPERWPSTPCTGRRP